MSGQHLHDPRGGGFFFDAGATCLDFAYTGGEGDLAVFEQLHRPTDLAAWLQRHVLGDDTSVAVSPAELREAKALRNALLRALWAVAAGTRPTAADLDAINVAAQAAPLAPQWDLEAGTRAWRRPVRVRQALSEMAREAIEIFTGPLADRIRQCDSDDCPLTFLDLSRPGSRRWCAMERCGNRHKVRAHRARQTATGD